ncbi:MAG: imidazolonepropionase [Bacteroidota bacterium]|nr:MAG: amidohydrolase [Bacteroidetes bacterium OLB12]GIL21601.1 MAG: imidazolonepropionase [Bacteroidota bacterium]HNR73391.1 amidohydrolase family protein [Cyclobacteriaceae bacterium]HNU42538.1 amidohydrolase family protein [Cyclobacteriaceae bacterium]
MKKLVYILLFVLGTVAYAQPPIPAKPQAKPVALTGGVAHIGNGQVIQNSIIAFDKGKLTIVADAATVKVDLSKHEVIDITGKHVYPGFILPNSPVGLQEVSAIRAMNDYNERGELNPNIRSLISYNTDSEYIPTFRFNGVLLAETTPTGGMISGSSSLMEMEGWNWEDAVHTADIGIHLNWPALRRRQFDFTTFTFGESPNPNYDKEVGELELFFSEAAAYGKQTSKETNLKLQAVQGLFDGTKVLFIHANTSKEIVESIRFAQRSGIQKITMIAGANALWVSDFLKENKIPVILPATHNLPDRNDDDVDLPYKLPHLLTQAGVMVSLSNDGSLHGGRNLGFYAGTAAAYGMSKEDALKTITSNTAKALGVEKRVGTLEVGKDATLFVSKGDALDYRTNVLSHGFISGKLIELPGIQEELYDRYSNKYGHKR